ncbi:MAG: DsbA family oxidoreductase [Beijerinckiaceae bacterium]|nr:DsbA family oxidoreductase [Beijerinckiaceae bacterium]
MAESGDRKKITVDIVSDVVCPWCFIGKRRLENALAMAPDLDIDLRWRPYQLDSTIPPGGISRQDYMDRKFGPERAATVHDRVRTIGAEVGIPFAFEKIKRSPNTLDAHRLLGWALEAGCQEHLKERLMQLYFVEGADVGDHDVLAKAAADCGMDGDDVRRRLSSDEDVESTRSEIDRIQNLGVNGVPFFIIASKYGLSGAQPAETLVEAMRQAAAEEDAKDETA